MPGAKIIQRRLMRSCNSRCKQHSKYIYLGLITRKLCNVMQHFRRLSKTKHQIIGFQCRYQSFFSAVVLGQFCSGYRISVPVKHYIFSYVVYLRFSFYDSYKATSSIPTCHFTHIFNQNL